MKKGSVIINTARGPVIDEVALLDALEDGHVSAKPPVSVPASRTNERNLQLGGAGLDVYKDEPYINPRFLALSNVTMLPHVGTATVETAKNVELRVMLNLRDFLRDGKGRDQVPGSTALT